MDDQHSNACLPPGWTLKVKVRDSGRKDKYYLPPSREKKFNSMVGVFRYLDKARSKAMSQNISNNLENVTTTPCRASKRLAGIKADPLLQLKYSRARRARVKQSGENETVINADKSTNISLPNDQANEFNALDGSKSKFIAESTENTMENNATRKDCIRVDAKLDYTGDFPFKDILLTDPCIAFAIQILTGETFENKR